MFNNKNKGYPTCQMVRHIPVYRCLAISFLDFIFILMNLMSVILCWVFQRVIFQQLGWNWKI